MSKRRYNAASTEWGELFGIPISSLTNDQLNSMKFDKLVELIGLDPRVERILGDKIADASDSDVGRIKLLTPEELEGRNYLLAKYNQTVFERDKRASDPNPYSRQDRSRYVEWSLLSSDNRRREYERYSNGKSSSINDESIDYKWLYSNHPEIALATALRVVRGTSNSSSYYNYHNRPFKHMIKSIPKEMVEAIIPEVFKKGKHVFGHALLCEHLPEEYAIQALRGITNRRVDIPAIKVPITKAMLNKLPPVMRLNCLNTMLFESKGASGINFVDIKTEEDLKELLFSSVLRHPTKVERLVKKFSYYYVPKSKPVS